MANVFISHSWEDGDLSRWIASEMRRIGLDVWGDFGEVRAGDNLPKRISDALDWCDTLLVLWSASARTSRWVELEWTNGIALGKTIIPCRVDSTVLPAILTNCLYVELEDRQAAIAALADTFGLSARAPLPTTATPLDVVYEYVGAIRGQQGAYADELHLFIRLGGHDDFSYFMDGAGPCGYKSWVRFRSFFSSRLFSLFNFKPLNPERCIRIMPWEEVKETSIRNLAFDIFASQGTSYLEALTEIAGIRECSKGSQWDPSISVRGRGA